MWSFFRFTLNNILTGKDAISGVHCIAYSFGWKHLVIPIEAILEVGLDLSSEICEVLEVFVDADISESAYIVERVREAVEKVSWDVFDHASRNVHVGDICVVSEQCSIQGSQLVLTQINIFQVDEVNESVRVDRIDFVPADIQEDQIFKPSKSSSVDLCDSTGL